jgi:hypothetical protein
MIYWEMRMEHVMERSTVKRQRQPVAADSFSPPYSLSSPAAKEALERLQKELIADPKKATAFFVSAGLLTGTGRLTKRFGGK